MWITCGEAREEVHRDRGMYAAVMTGIGTVLGDDPLLTCRVAGGRQSCEGDLRYAHEATGGFGDSENVIACQDHRGGR